MKIAKRTLIGIYLCLIGTTFLVGCDRWVGEPKFLYEYYVDEYYYVESITMGSPMINFNAPILHSDNFMKYSEYENKTKFEKTKRKYRDTYYNRELWGRMPNIAYCNEFVRFDVISDTDFDEAHPAGTSLADIVLLKAVSPYKYIKSGYTDEYDWKSSDLPQDFAYEAEVFDLTLFYDVGYHPVNKLLSELTAEDMLLLDEVSIRFVKMPDHKDNHIITVIVEDKEKEMTCQIDWIFE